MFLVTRWAAFTFLIAASAITTSAFAPATPPAASATVFRHEIIRGMVVGSLPAGGTKPLDAVRSRTQPRCAPRV